MTAGGHSATAPRRARFARFARIPLLSAVAQRLRHRADTEHEMTINRLVLSGAVFVYLLVSSALGSAEANEMLRTHAIYFAFYYLGSVVLCGHILWRPAVCPTRRLVGILFDIGMFSYGMHIGDAATAPFFPIYLWIILGNGFRFGIPYLAAAAVVALIGFAAVIQTTDIWQTHQSLGVGLLASLALLPFYVSTLIRKLSAAKRQAEEASNAKSRFLASVSHELRTPLNAIIGLSDLLRDTSLDSDQHEMTRTIGTAGRSLLSLINTLLDFSRIEERRIVSHPVEFDLHALLMDVRAILAVQAQAKSVRLALHVSARTPRFVRADKRHLEEILVNLGGNAVKFTERGHVVIAVDGLQQDGYVRLRCEVSDPGIGITPDAQARIFDSFTQADETIIDRFGGTGLGLAIVKQLVEFHGGTIGVESTVGIGSTFWFELAAAAADVAALEPVCWTGAVVLLSPDARLRTLAERVGADARFATTADEAASRLADLRREGVRRPVMVVDGAAAEVASIARRLIGEPGADAPVLVLMTDAPVAGMLPRDLRGLFVTVLARPVEAGDLAAALRIARGNETSVEGPRSVRQPPRRRLAVLVGEDNRTNQMVIAKILERAGHTVQLADNGEAVLDALEQRAFDIVLMDINMPVMNGIEATKLYRFAALGSARIPIVALTADATADARARCEAAGMDDCLTKPIEPACLLDVIDRLVPVGGAAAAPQPIEGVAHIAEHPRFQSGSACVDPEKLKDLEMIGGKDFVAELVAQFNEDAISLVRELAAAVAEGNVESFRERAHALRSGAANIGAHGVYEMCLSWRQIGTNELDVRGHEHVLKLNEEIGRVAAALAAHVATLHAAEGSSGGTVPLSRPA